MFTTLHTKKGEKMMKTKIFFPQLFLVSHKKNKLKSNVLNVIIWFIILHSKRKSLSYLLGENKPF
jgi:hypothetical protein